MNSESKYALVALSGPLRRSFVYRIPPGLILAGAGQRLMVPFGRSRKTGYFLSECDAPAGITIRDIIKPIDEVSLFSGELFELSLWIAEYYFANPADVLTAALPAPMKKSKAYRYQWSDKLPDYLPNAISRKAKPGRLISKPIVAELQNTGFLKRLLTDLFISRVWPVEDEQPGQRLSGYRVMETANWEEFYEKGKFKPAVFVGSKSRTELTSEGWTDYQLRKAQNAGLLEPLFSNPAFEMYDFIKAKENIADLKLTGEQQIAFDTVAASLPGGFSPFLLHGVTGSGKTLVYCHLGREVIKQGKTVLVLTPEIALTGATMAYFKAFFSQDVTLYHSAMTDREKTSVWQGVSEGKFKIVVGPRSALFAPLPNLGLIIVDEEHDGSYKQDNPAPRFHGRDSAVMRARINNIPVLLGSASPSFESYYNAESGRYKLLTLTKRPAGASLPLVKMIDMKKDRLGGELFYFSFRLKAEAEKRIEQGQQVILYLNRRGYSSQLKCLSCGQTPSCKQCQVSLTYHLSGRRLSCHYCGYTIKAVDVCPECQSDDIIYSGVGTQKVEHMLPRLIEKAVVSRMDSDSSSGRKKAHNILADFADKKSNVLLGTQMVTKGLDIPGVTLVGVLAADAALSIPDFRAAEKVFARLLQVSGRSGRSKRQGEVLMQTYDPENPVLRDAAAGSYDSFYKREIESRKALNYPPFSHLINFTLSGVDDNQLAEVAKQLCTRLKEKINSTSLDCPVLGPNSCAIELLRGQYRRHFLVKTDRVVSFVRMLTDWESQEPRFGLPSMVRISVDVDPDDMM